MYTNYNTLIGWQRYNAANNKMLYGYGRREIVVLQGTFDFEVLGAIESVPSIDVSFTLEKRPLVLALESFLLPTHHGMEDTSNFILTIFLLIVGTSI